MNRSDSFEAHVASRDLKRQARSGFKDLSTIAACRIAWRAVEVVRGSLASVELDALREAAGRAAWGNSAESAALAVEAYRAAVVAAQDAMPVRRRAS